MKEKEHISKTFSGIRWSGFSQFIVQIINLILNIVLARLLSPYEFGIIAMITVFISFMNLFKDFGFGAVLISQKSVDELDYSTVFWANLIMGVVLTCLLYSTRNLISAFYNEPVLEKLITVISFLFIVQAFNYVQIIILRKHLEFKKLAIVNVSSVIISGIIGILLAIKGFGVWSLIYKDLSLSVINLIMIWRFSSWRPTYKFSISRFKFFIKTGFALIGTKMVTFFTKNIDNALIGKFIGASPLGIYNRAFSFMSYPVHRITGVLSSVLFPSLSIIQNDIERVKDIYFRATRMTSFIIFLIMGLLFVNVTEFVLIVLGEQWSELIPVLKILIFPAALQSICLLTEDIFRSQNRYQFEFKLNLINSIITILAIIYALKWGIIGVSKAILFSTILTSFITLISVAKVLQDNFFNILKYIFPSLICFMILIVFDYFIKNTEILELSLLVSFLVKSFFSLFLYILFIYILDRKILFDVSLFFKKIINTDEK